MRVLGRRPGADPLRPRRGRGPARARRAWSRSASPARRPTTTWATGWSRSRSRSRPWLDLHRPDAVAVERVFAQANVRTVMGTAQAGAVAIICAARRGLPVVLHTPSEVKAAVTGSGRADKAQVGADGRPAAAADAPPEAGRRRRRPRAGASATCGARRRRPGCAAARRRGAAGDRQRRGHRRGADRRRRRRPRRRRRAVVQTTAGTRARLRVGERRPRWPPAWSCARTA